VYTLIELVKGVVQRHLVLLRARQRDLDLVHGGTCSLSPPRILPRMRQTFSTWMRGMASARYGDCTQFQQTTLFLTRCGSLCELMPFLGTATDRSTTAVIRLNRPDQSNHF
jgi:hypothetical protein